MCSGRLYQATGPATQNARLPSCSLVLAYHYLFINTYFLTNEFYLFIYLIICLFVCSFVCLFVFCISIYLFVNSCIYACNYLFIYDLLTYCTVHRNTSGINVNIHGTLT